MIQRSPRPLAGFKGPTSKGGEGRVGNGRGEGGVEEGRGGERGGETGREGKDPKVWLTPPCSKS